MALIGSGVALGSDRIDSAFRWVMRADEPSADPDPDHDGLTTAAEEAGVVTKTGQTFVTDPEATDSDQDGLTDGEEVGALITTGGKTPIRVGVADPRKADTDDDGVLDSDEYFLGTDPRSGDSDGDGMPDSDELDFGSDPLVANADKDDYSDLEERQRGSAPLAYDESGWRARLNTGLTVLKYALSAADKISGGGKLRVIVKAVQVARAAGVAAPVIWNALKDRDWADLSPENLRDEVFGGDVDKLGEALEGGRSVYVAYVGRAPGGALAYVGVTDEFERLTADHGGQNVLSVVGGSEPMTLNQARAVGEAIIKCAYDRMENVQLANGRHVIDPGNSLYLPAITWGSEQLDRAKFNC